MSSNVRMSEVQAAVGRVQLTKLPALNARRRRRYLRLSKNLQMLALAVDETVWVQFPVQYRTGSLLTP